MMICVTLNPCLDKTLIVPPWQPGEHQVRGIRIEQVVGGKGVNVARGLKRLGQSAVPALFLGGELGQLCERLLIEQDGLAPVVARTGAATREILTVRTTGTATQTAFFDPNPQITAAEADDLIARVTTIFAQHPSWCAFSGSSPTPQTDHVFAELIRRARAANVNTLVDTYGRCLEPALSAGPDVVKLNRHEWEQASGQQLDSPASIRRALQQLRGYGARCGVITFGAQGMAAAWDEQVGAWKPPPVSLINPIGAGDAMAAGLLDALSRDLDCETACGWGMACAVASVEQWVACDFSLAAARAMVPRLVPADLADLLA